MDDYHHVEFLSVRNMITDEFLFSCFHSLPSMLTAIVAWHCRMVIDQEYCGSLGIQITCETL